jgi:hypothetical protein
VRLGDEGRGGDGVSEEKWVLWDVLLLLPVRHGKRKSHQ